MNAFSYAKPETVSDALALSESGQSKFIAGGTNLIDLMKARVARPSLIVDVNHLPLNRIEETPDGGLRVGALVSNADLACDPRIEERYPLLSRAILAGASPQLRNMATTGGNLLQRTRCYYFYDTRTPCNKRVPGSGCPAITGLNRIHAILGASDKCIAVHPSDMCVAMAALAAVVRVTGPAGERVIPFTEFHRLPGDTPEIDTNLKPHEIITAVDLPPQGFPRNAAYVKIRDRASYAFALVSVAAALDMNRNTIKEARLALGGVAHKPWRDIAAEALLTGKPATLSNFGIVADAVLRDARGYEHNAFKIELARRAIVRALEEAAAAGRSS